MVGKLIELREFVRHTKGGIHLVFQLWLKHSFPAAPQQQLTSAAT
jgi:hypothetical protein